MPIRAMASPVPGVLLSEFTGRVTDADLLAYYEALIENPIGPPWLEVVDGRGVEHMGLSPHGQGRLADTFSLHLELLRGARVAMVAQAGSAVYGMFRMWEITREHLDYRVEVFTDFEKALSWIGRDPAAGS